MTVDSSQGACHWGVGMEMFVNFLDVLETSMPPLLVLFSVVVVVSGFMVCPGSASTPPVALAFALAFG